MLLERTESVISAIEKTIAETAIGGVVENFLAQYAAVVLYSEMEESLSTLIRARLSYYTHEVIGLFITNNFSDLIRRTPKSDISKFSARFGDAFNQAFNGLIDDREITRYSNVIQARQDVGHRKGSNITLGEVRLGLSAAIHILSALSDCFDVVCGKMK